MTPLAAYEKESREYWMGRQPDRRLAAKRLQRAWRKAGGKRLDEVDPSIEWGCFRLREAIVDTCEHFTWEDPLGMGRTWGSEPWSSYVVLPIPAAFR